MVGFLPQKRKSGLPGSPSGQLHMPTRKASSLITGVPSGGGGMGD